MRTMIVIDVFWCQICSRLILCFGHNLWVFPLFRTFRDFSLLYPLIGYLLRLFFSWRFIVHFWGWGLILTHLTAPEPLEFVRKWCFEWRHEWIEWCNLPSSLSIWENGLNTFRLCDFTMNNGGEGVLAGWNKPPW